MPLRAMTSDRVWGIQPSDRSPRTALHHVGIGVVSHILTGEDCAATVLLPSSAPAIAMLPMAGMIACLKLARTCEQIRSAIFVSPCRVSHEHPPAGERHRNLAGKRHTPLS
jgi:hypothetical protein